MSHRNHRNHRKNLGKYAVTSLWLFHVASLFVLVKTSFPRPNQFAPSARFTALFTAFKVQNLPRWTKLK